MASTGESFFKSKKHFTGGRNFIPASKQMNEKGSRMDETVYLDRVADGEPYFMATGLSISKEMRDISKLNDDQAE